MTIEEEIEYLRKEALNEILKISGVPKEYIKKTDNVSAKGLEAIKSQHSYPEFK